MRVLRLPFLTKETLSQLVHRSSKDVCSRTTHQSFKYSLSKFGICTRPVSSNVLTSRSAKIDSRQTTSPSSRNGRSFSWTGRRAEEGSWNGNGSTAEILDGKLHSAEWQQTARIQVDNLKKEHSIHPAVAVILVGQRADSMLYVWRKREACLQAGINFYCANLPTDVPQEELNSTIRKFCDDPTIHGVMVQLPLPPHLSEEAVSEALNPLKDVDGYHPLNMGRLAMRGRLPAFVPCTALGSLELLARTRTSVEGKHCVVVGNSNTVGTPMSMLLRNAGAASVKILHYPIKWPSSGPTFTAPPAGQDASPYTCARIDSRTTGYQGACLDNWFCSSTREHVTFSPDVPKAVREADIVVVTVGVPKLVRKEWIRPGAVVLDIGINPIEGENGSQAGAVNPGGGLESAGFQVVGDVDFDEVSKVASKITPVPGGIGPMTVAALVHNVVYAAKLINGLPLDES